ncbi:MAG: ABC transporter ATP-binding protein [Bacteroidetes bacterium]|nr:ABC transporter ATP-binding protein [Bacteroidota bacterium]
MPNPVAAEIASCFVHHDYSLAVRRMLDSCLDTGQAPLIRQAVSWSRRYRIHEKDNKGSAPEGWLGEADGLLQQINSISTPPVRQGVSLVEAEGVSKTYRRGRFSLQRISLQVHTGDILGVVGENGNGKTTLLRCLAGQLALDEGRLSYRLLRDDSHYAIKSHVAFIPQRIPRWYGTLRDNLHFAASIAGIKGDTNVLMVDFMLERLNLSDYAHLNWNQISSGYRTRFEIARILLQKPSLLILDEPLANLDINAQQTMLTDLRFIARSAYHPMGVLLSSQQLHEVEKVADTVLLIKQGACLFRTRQDTEVTEGYAFEIETTASREDLVQALGGDGVKVHFNGGFYTITSSQHTVQDMITALISRQLPVTYFRDITHSSKRFF